MIKYKKWIIYLIPFLVLVSACEDIFEEDISGETINLVNPLDGTVIDRNYVEFSWQQLEGSNQYRIQVFTDQNAPLKDTVTNKNNFQLDFEPGHYSWHVRAENFAYLSDFSEKRKFDIISNNDLTLQKVILSNPIDSLYTKQQNLLVQWRPLNFADAYNLEIVKAVQGNLTQVMILSGLENTSYEIEANKFGEDAVYYWKVKALNDFSETEFSQRRIFIDNEPPGKAILEFPADNYTSSESLTISFAWKIPLDSGEVTSGVSSQLEIALDVNFEEIVEIIDPGITESETDYIFNEKGIFYWRVKLKDQAGNMGEYSLTRKISIQ